MPNKLFTGCLLLILSVTAAAQTNKEKADKIFQEAIRIMDEGELDRSILLLDSAQKLDPDNFLYDYEKGFAYGQKKDYKTAIRCFQASITHADANDQCYQMLGNNYDMDGQPEKAMEAYNLGLKKFPNSARLYGEVGIIAYNQKDYSKAILIWEKGIEADPTYPTSYFRLAKLYSASKDRIWAIFYGEMFMLLEPNTRRSQEISKVIFNAYKESIYFSDDNKLHIDFARNIIKFDDSKKFKMPFDQLYGLDFIIGMLPSMLTDKKDINIAYLHAARSGFLNQWFSKQREKEYNNIIIDFQKKIKDNVHLEAYDYWLMLYGNRDEFDTWYAANRNKADAFIEWLNKNDVTIDNEHFFLRTKID